MCCVGMEFEFAARETTTERVRMRLPTWCRSKCCDRIISGPHGHRFAEFLRQ